MNAVDLIRGDKSKITLGSWAAGHIPRSAFPLSRVKEKQYRLGHAWKWRLVRFESCGHQCRLLLSLNEEKEIFRIRFGVDVGGDTAVLVDHEFHSSEPGWHCHFTLSDVSSVVSGAARGNGKARWPREAKPGAKFGVSEMNALSIALQRFRLAEPGSLL